MRQDFSKIKTRAVIDRSKLADFIIPRNNFVETLNEWITPRRILLSDRREKILQRLTLYLETSPRNKIQSRSTVVEISRSRSLFEDLKTLLFEKVQEVLRKT